MLGDEVGLHTPCLQGIWNDSQRQERGRETISGYMAEVILGHVMIHKRADVPNSSQFITHCCSEYSLVIGV